MNEYPVHDSTLPMSDQVEFRRIYPLDCSMTSINGQRNLETALMRLRNYSQITESGSVELGVLELSQLLKP